MKQDDWSNFAEPTGPDTRQPDMVSREAVLALLDEAYEATIGVNRILPKPNPMIGAAAGTLKEIANRVRKL